MIPALRCRSLGLAFPRARGVEHRVLAGLDLDVARHQFVAIIGPSGCGKTSLLRLMAGLLAPSSGEIERPTRADGRADCAFVFQEADLAPWLTVAGNVELGRLRLRERAETTSARVTETLQTVGLSDWRQAFPRQLSLGMQRRVSLARAFASDADLVLLDEPFAALDAQARWRLQRELERFWREQPRTVVFVTHDVGEAIWLAERVVVLGGSPAKIVREVEVPFPRPRNPEIRWSESFRDLERDLWRSLPDAEAEAVVGTAAGQERAE